MPQAPGVGIERLRAMPGLKVQMPKGASLKGVYRAGNGIACGMDFATSMEEITRGLDRIEAFIRCKIA